MPRPRLGYVLVLTGAVLFVINAGVSRVAMRAGLDPGVFTTMRVTGAALVFIVLSLVIRRSALRPPTGRSLLLIAALGFVGVAGLQLTYNIAIDRLPVGVALLLEYLAPVLVVLWVRLVRKDAVHNRMWIAIACTLIGLAIVGRVWDGLAFDALGVAMGLAAAVCFAAYFLLGEHNLDVEDPLRVILWAFIIGAIVMNIFAPLTGFDGLGHDASLLGNLDSFSVPLWLAIVWIVLLGTVTPFFAQLVALNHLPATIVTIVATLEPVGVLILGWVWFNESLTAIQVFGGVLVLSGIGLAQTARTKPAALPPQ